MYRECIIIIQILSVTVARFPIRGALNYCLARFFAENCMKMKEIGPKAQGARVPSAPGFGNALHTGLCTSTRIYLFT